MAFRNALRLNKRVALYVPSTVDVDVSVNSSEEVAAAARFLASIFGGATATAATGYWVSEQRGLVAEQTTIVYAYGGAEAVEAALDSIEAYAVALRERMRQEAVSVEIGNELLIF